MNRVGNQENTTMKINIEYCVQWNYSPEAVSLAEQIEQTRGISSELQPGAGGAFEVSYGNILIFSKKQVHRFPDLSEILAELDQLVPEKN